MEGPLGLPYFLAKKWNAVDLQEEKEVPIEEPEVEDVITKSKNSLGGEDSRKADA